MTDTCPFYSMEAVKRQKRETETAVKLMTGVWQRAARQDPEQKRHLMTGPRTARPVSHLMALSAHLMPDSRPDKTWLQMGGYNGIIL